MKIQYASDLHLEFPENRDFLKKNPIQAVGDILILAGDIVPFALLNRHTDFFKFLSDHFEFTYWIPGNHEYYHYDISQKCGSMNESIYKNVFLVNDTVLSHGNINFIFSTLWTRISPANQWEIERRISDFHVIKYNGSRYSADSYNKLHEQSIKFVRQAIENNSNEQSIVVSHHVPTFLNYPEKYKGDSLNEAFAVELFDLIESDGPNYWIYGHHHFNGPNFMIGNTILTTNQLGYIQYEENKKFNDKKIFEI